MKLTRKLLFTISWLLLALLFLLIIERSAAIHNRLTKQLNINNQQISSEWVKKTLKKADKAIVELSNFISDETHDLNSQDRHSFSDLAVAFSQTGNANRSLDIMDPEGKILTRSTKSDRFHAGLTELFHSLLRHHALNGQTLLVDNGIIYLLSAVISFDENADTPLIYIATEPLTEENKRNGLWLFSSHNEPGALFIDSNNKQVTAQPPFSDTDEPSLIELAHFVIAGEEVSILTKPARVPFLTLLEQLWIPALFYLVTLLLILSLLSLILRRSALNRISLINRRTDLAFTPEPEKLETIPEKDELDHLYNNFVAILKHNQQHIAQAACFDNLTHLSNRYLFNQLLEREIERATRHHKHFALIYLDIDGFKHFNDNYGHPFGDKILVEFSNLLQNQVRESDLISRWGNEKNIARLAGDEFAILLTELKQSHPAVVVAKRIISALEEPLVIDDKPVNLSVSMGIAHFPADAFDAHELIKKADAAMYQAKACGKNQFKVFSKELNQHIEQQETIYQGLLQALSNNEFELYYQPYIDTQTHTIAGAEALLRWSSKELGNVSPAIFIPVAEQYGLITEIDRWVLRHTLKMINTRQLAKYGIKISINISNLHFHNRYFPEYLVNCMEEFDISPDQFELEITETAVTELDEQFLEVANAISAIGVSLVLDDFGTGFTSLSHLSMLPISKIKIDRSHVKEISKQAEGIKLVDVLLSISDSYQLQITAEGVEYEWQYDYLKRRKCNFLQGFLFHRPEPEEKLLSALEQCNQLRIP